MFDCLLPCLPRARERRLQHQCQERAERLQQREADLDARERRLQELEATERRYQALAAPDGQAALAAEKTRDAIQSLGTALGAWGGRGYRDELGGDALREARSLLERSPWTAKSAFSALIKIGEVAETCDEEALGAVKAAERAVRDVVVLRCCPQAEPANRGAFLEAAEEAFGSPLDRELQAVLLLAYHKIARCQAQAKAEAKTEAKAKANPAPF